MTSASTKAALMVSVVLWTLYVTHISGLKYNIHEHSSQNIINSEISRRSILLSPPAAALSIPLVSRAVDTQSSVLVGGDRVKFPGSSIPKNGFPVASFGLQVYDDNTAYKLTLLALEVGYRNFFASVLAGNQRGFAKAVKASGIPRDDLYICGTVLSNRSQGEKAAYQKTKQGCNENLEAMAAGGITHLDMIMLDYPGPDAASIRGQWRAFEDMKKEGTVDDLAVSNFSPGQLDVILTDPGTLTKPTVNQLPFSVANNRKELLNYNAERNILVQSWSPLSRVLSRPTTNIALELIGKKYGKSAAQVGLRWIVQNGATFCTQSKSKKHFEEDLNVFDFNLSDKDMEQISQLS